MLGLSNPPLAVRRFRVIPLMDVGSIKSFTSTYVQQFSTCYVLQHKDGHRDFGPHLEDAPLRMWRRRIVPNLHVGSIMLVTSRHVQITFALHILEGPLMHRSTSCWSDGPLTRTRCWIIPLMHLSSDESQAMRDLGGPCMQKAPRNNSHWCRSSCILRPHSRIYHWRRFGA